MQIRFWLYFSICFLFVAYLWAEDNISYYGQISRDYGGDSVVPSYLKWDDDEIETVNIDTVNLMQEIRIEEFEEETKLFIRVKKIPPYNVFLDKTEEYLIVDFLSDKIYYDFQNKIQYYPNSTLVESSQFSFLFTSVEVQGMRALDMIMIRLTEIFKYEVEDKKDEIEIIFKIDKEAVLKKRNKDELEEVKNLLGADSVSVDESLLEEDEGEASVGDQEGGQMRGGAIEEEADSEDESSDPSTKEGKLVQEKNELEQKKEEFIKSQSDNRSVNLDGVEVEHAQLSPDSVKKTSESETLALEAEKEWNEKAVDVLTESLNKLGVDTQKAMDFSSPQFSSEDRPEFSFLCVPEEFQVNDNVRVDSVSLSFLSFDDQAKGDILTLEECFQLSLNKSLNAQVAIEKIKLSKMRLWEAKRGLFPQANIELINTKGKVDETRPFDEKEYKLTVDQNIYDGGEKNALVRQAEINLEVAQATFEKVKMDLFYDVEEAYYNLLLAKVNISVQRRLLFELDKLIRLEKEKLDKGLIRLVDYKNMKASFNQVQVQLTTAYKDYKVSRLTLGQLIGKLKYKIPPSIGFRQIDIVLEDALWIAKRHNADHIVNQLMVEYQELERQVHLAKDSFKVDLSSRFGWYGSAYEEDDLELSKNWYAGFRVTKILGGSTVEGNIGKENSSPRLGQTQRGSNFSRSLKVTLLNNLKVFSDRKQADISFQEALVEVGKTKKQLETDIHNAFYDYQKSIVQLDAAYDKVLYREEELKVHLKNALLGDGSISQVFEAKIRLADEKSYYFQSLSNYYIAIATINKMVGLVSYYH